MMACPLLQQETVLPKKTPPWMHDRLLDVRGRLSFAASLANASRFGVGGPAEALFRPADREDLMRFLTFLPTDVPVTIIGVGSNLLIRDGGVPGLVIRLGAGFAAIASQGLSMAVGTAALGSNVANLAAQEGIAGLEFLAGIPGTIGGGIRMNAGAYGSDMSQILVQANAIDRQGRMHRLDREELGFTYRHCQVPADWIFTDAILGGQAGMPADIFDRLALVRASRESSQPIRGKTGGSTFKNPPGHRAWELIDKAGCRGLRLGGAMVSEKHANFLINTGAATACEIESLGEEIRRRVQAACGIALEWEIQRIGLPKEEGAP